MPSPSGYLLLVLHAHLPFVRHPEHDNFLEERWLFEAMTETYLPLLSRLNRLREENVPVKLAMSFSPTLLAMLGDPLLQARYLRYLDQTIELVSQETQRTRWTPTFHRLAWFYYHRLTEAKRLYLGTYRGDLIAAFRHLINAGTIEPLATCATHGFLPLLSQQPSAVRAQIRVGIQALQQAFDRKPAGFWLPECGFSAGQDALLADEGIRYTILDAHGVLFGSPRPRYGVYAPVACPNSGLVVFGRDLAASRSVWSPTEGYPGDPDYREFYRDLGFDLDHHYLKPFLGGDGVRTYTGIKYYRVTGPTTDKAPYDPDRALEKAAAHAGQFLLDRAGQVQALKSVTDRPPAILFPFDAELFGHWWFEGPDWLEILFRKAPSVVPDLAWTTPSEYLSLAAAPQVVDPAPSSWGLQGYNEVWLNGANDWIYRDLHAMTERMSALAAQEMKDPLKARAVAQMGRELLLAQSSDWPFILKNGTHTTYAYRRLQEHTERFYRLAESVERGVIDEKDLVDIENRDNLFPFLKPRDFVQAAHPASGRQRDRAVA